MNKKTVYIVILSLILLVVAIYLISSTYARYTSEFSGSATGHIALWKVKVQGATQQTFTPTFTYDDNQYVVDNKIAPGRSVSAEIEIDLTGTEVAVDVLATADTKSLQGIVGESNIKTSVVIDEQTANGETGNLIQLPNNQAFTEANGKKKVKIVLSWENDDEYNSSDVTIGTTQTEWQIPVTLKLQQHIDAN